MGCWVCCVLLVGVFGFADGLLGILCMLLLRVDNTEFWAWGLVLL